MGKTSAAVKNRYAAKTYDRVILLVPKGAKGTLQAAATAADESINGYVNAAVLARMGFKSWDDVTTDKQEE
jgi:hypothetical protein